MTTQGGHYDMKDLHAKLILADYVQVSDGKLTSVGAGWNWIRIAGPATFGVGVMIDWPWTEVGSHHKITIDVFDEDGHVFALAGPDGTEVPLHFSQEIPLVASPGAEKGSRVMQTLALNFAGVQLDAGSRYEIRMEIDDEADAEWLAAFSTRS
jgi:hypothetical protein